MHSSTTTRTFGASTLRLTAFLERRFHAYVMVRDRLLFDSAYVPQVKKPRSFVHVYAQLRGSLSIDGGPLLAGPQAFTLDETEFDRRTPGSGSSAAGLTPNFLFGLYRQDPSRFSCLLRDEWDVTTLIQIMAHEP